MGAESSLLENCEWQDPTTDGIWSLRSGKLVDGSKISQFTVQKKDKAQTQLLEKLIKNLKSVRHPSILTYICSDVASPSPELITEKAVPLETVLAQLGSTEICAGLHTVLDALAFLHDNVGASHNNVHTGAIYVSADGSWRLGGLEHMCRFPEATAAFMESCKPYRNQEALSPEEKQGKVNTEADIGHARDIYAFAVMTESLLEKMHDLGDLTKTFELRIQDECLHSDPRHRPQAKSLLSDRLFNTEFLDIALFLKNITLKSEEERKKFFSTLLPRLLGLPEELVARRLVPSLLSRFVFLDQSAVEYVMPSLLTPSQGETVSESPSAGKVTPLFTEAVFQQFVVPKLVKIFSVHDFHVHILLLQYFHSFVNLVDKEDLEFDVFPQILLGLRDSSDQVVALSLHALAELVPILGRDVVIGGKSKKYFKEGLPKSQSNEAILNNKHTNFRSMLGKTRLVDLAKLSEKGKVSAQKPEDIDRKWKDREIRREEMKKKREDRKLAREKSKELVQTVDDITLTKLKTTEESEVVEHSQHSITSLAESPRRLDSSHVISDHNNDWSEKNERKDSLISDSIRSVESSEVNEMEEGDWSGWSEEGDNSDISDEIERELQDMDLKVESPNHSSLKSHEVIPSKSNINITNSASSKTSKSAALKLVINKPKLNVNPLPDTKCNDVSRTGSAKLEEVRQSAGSSQSKSQNTNSFSSRSPAKTTKQQDLGAEFEIKSVKIKPIKKVEDPFDFFADMAPTIEIKISKVEDSLNDLPADKSSQKSETKMEVSDSKFSMQVSETAAEEAADGGGGWGDDDW